MKKFHIIVFLSCALAPISAQCKEALKICSANRGAPIEVHGANGEWDGYEIYLLQKFAQQINTSIEFIQVNSFPQLFTSLANNECDAAASGIWIRPERQEKYLFSDAIYETSFGAVELKSNAGILYDFNNINKNNVRIAVESGTVQSKYVKAEFPQAVVHFFDSHDSAMQSLYEHKSDLYIASSLVTSFLEKQDPNTFHFIKPISLVPPPAMYSANLYMQVGVMFRKDEPVLRNKFNRFLETFKDSGELDNLKKFYFENSNWDKENSYHTDEIEQ